MEKVQPRKRTLIDKLVSGGNNFRFSLIEPIRLRALRFKYQNFYLKEDSSPLISVYIPTYNRAEILVQRSIPSVLAQTYKNFELLIIGDHCTDKTAELVNKIKDPRIIFYNLPTRGYRYPPTVENHWYAGPVVAANQALEMVKGKWIARLDDDDIWLEDHLAALLRFAQAGNYEFVSSQSYEERYGQREILVGREAQDPFYGKRRGPARGDNPRIGPTHNWLYRSYLKFFKYNINCWRKSWNRVNDTDIVMRLYRAGVKMGFLARPLSLYLPRPGEETVGFDAYQIAKEEKLKHFEFK